MDRRNGTKLLEVPRGVLDSIMRIYQTVEESQDEFEDFVFSKDERFLKKMRGARSEHKRGQLRSIDELKIEL